MAIIPFPNKHKLINKWWKLIWKCRLENTFFTTLFKNQQLKMKTLYNSTIINTNIYAIFNSNNVIYFRQSQYVKQKKYIN